MKIKDEKVSKFQMGGAMAAPEAAPQAAPADQAQGGGDPFSQIMEMAMQALESQDCQAAMAVCEGLLQLAQQASGGEGGAPAEQAPAEPVFKRGGKLTRK